MIKVKKEIIEKHGSGPLRNIFTNPRRRFPAGQKKGKKVKQKKRPSKNAIYRRAI